MAEMTETRLEKLANKAADKALKTLAARESNAVQFDVPSHLDGIARLGGDDTEADDGEAVAAFDIFDWCEDATKKGHQIQYVLKRNGEMLTTKYHPYSWEQIQKEFKGGQYQIVAKSLTTKRYLKSETRTLSDPVRGVNDSVEVETAQKTTVVQAPQPQGPNFMELFTLFQSMNEKQRVEAREAARENAQLAQQNMLAFVEMMKSSQTGSQTMFFEIAKMTQTVSEKLAESQRAMFEKMENRFEKILDKVSQNQTSAKTDKPEFGLLELMKMQQDSQEKGFQLFNKLSQIAEQKAAERVEMIEELRGDAPESTKKEKSMTDTLIETMLPTIATALAGQGSVPTQTAQVAPTRRALPAPQVRTAPHSNNAAQSRRTAQTNAPQTTRTTQNASTQGASVTSGTTSRTVHGQTPVKRNALGLAVATPVAQTAVKPTAETPKPVETAPSASLKDKFTEILIPSFGELLVNQAAPNVAAVEIVATLEKNGHNQTEFLSHVSLADLMGVVATFGLPDEANPWFTEVYAHIQGSAGVVTR